MDSILYMSGTPELQTLQHRLYIYLNQTTSLANVMQNGVSSSQAANAMASVMDAKTIKYTISMVTVIPILAVYPFMQRYFEKGIMLGAVKG